MILQHKLPGLENGYDFGVLLLSVDRRLGCYNSEDGPLLTEDVTGNSEMDVEFCVEFCITKVCENETYDEHRLAANQAK